MIYTRISSDRTGKAAGVARQEEECRRLAADLGWMIVAVLPENDASAVGKRPQYAKLLTMLASGEADALISWHTDRLYRRVEDLLPLIEIVKERGTVIRTCRSGHIDLSNASGVMNAEILAAVAKYEREHAIERMIAKKDANRAAGVNHGGPRTFGYRAVKPKAKGADPEVPQVDEREAERIREAAVSVLAHDADPEAGLTLAGICRAWSARGVRTPRGNDWTVPSLRKLLLSPRIAGRVAHKGEDAGPAQWAAILDHDTWLAVRRVLTDKSRSSHLSWQHDGKTIRYLGSGLYKCHCGGIVRPGGAHAGRPQLYRCTEKAHLVRSTAGVDGFVERVIIARLCREDARELFTPRGPAAPTGPTTDELTARHAALSARLEALAEAFAGDDDSDPVEYRAAAKGIRQRLAEVEQMITDRVTAEAAAADPGPVGEVDLPELARRHKDDAEGALIWWRARYGMDVRRRILAALVAVTLHPARTGRPPGWKPGEPYFDAQSVEVEWVR